MGVDSALLRTLVPRDTASSSMSIALDEGRETISSTPPPDGGLDMGPCEGASSTGMSTSAISEMRRRRRMMRPFHSIELRGTLVLVLLLLLLVVVLLLLLLMLLLLLLLNAAPVEVESEVSNR